MLVLPYLATIFFSTAYSTLSRPMKSWLQIEAPPKRHVFLPYSPVAFNWPEQDSVPFYSLPSSSVISLPSSSVLITTWLASAFSSSHISDCPPLFTHSQGQRQKGSANKKNLLTSLKGGGSLCGTSSCYWPFWSAPFPGSLCIGPAGPGWGPTLPSSRPARPAPSVGG